MSSTLHTDRLAAALVADEPKIDAAVAKAAVALAAWRAWPDCLRHGYPQEAKRLATRAAAAIVAVVEAAAQHDPEEPQR